MYKIIAIDADGTLLDKTSRITPENKQAIQEAQRTGVYVALCSGRSIVSLRKFAAELELLPALSHVISFNGGVVFDGGYNVIRDVRMTRETAVSLLKHIRRFNVTVAVYTETDQMMCECDASEIEKYTSGALVLPTFVDSLEHAISVDPYKIIIYGENEVLKGVAEYIPETEVLGQYDMCFSSKRLLEFSDVLSNKGAGLSFVCQSLGLDIKTDAVAVGDSFNDLSMITDAALGVCMANGEEYVKTRAKYVTERTNHESGVAEVINKFFLCDPNVK